MAEIDRYLKFMVQSGASDFHIFTGVRPTYRVHGSMRSASAEKTEEFGADAVRRIVEETMPERNRKEFEARRDTDFAYEIPGMGRFRVNAFVDRMGPGAVFRHIPQEIKSLEQLGPPPILATFCDLSKGLVIVTGPTGSGKSTTLAAMVDHINRNRKDHIVTIEDPIEFVHRNRGCLINQREVSRHTDSFKSALRAALRQDPDIMREGKTYQIPSAIQTGGKLGMQSLNSQILELVRSGVVDAQEAYLKSVDRADLASQLRAAGFSVEA